MPKVVDIRLLATETATAVFGKVEKSAKSLAGTLGSFGSSTRDGFSRAIRDSDKLGESFDRTASRAKVTSGDLREMGLALTGVAAGLAAAGQIAMTHERLIVSVEQAYKNAAAEMISFSDTLASETGNLFNDTDILAGERYFATLYTNYGVAADQIQALMRTTANLAAAAGLSFENASYRITAAIRGEAEAAELLGLTMNQQSIDRENLTFKMTNQEAAQFRINALFEQSAWSMGAANRIAESSYGQWARLTNQFKDAAQAVGEFVGPYGAMIAGFGGAAVGLAQFANGFTALATGIKVATTAMATFIASPAGLAITAVGTALALATKWFIDNRNEAQKTAAAWAEVAQSAETLEEQIRRLAMFDWTTGRWAEQFSNKVVAEFDWMDQYLRTTLYDTFGTGNWFDQMVQEAAGRTFEVDNVNFFSTDEARRAWQVEADALIDDMLPTPAQRDRFYKAFGDLLSLEGVIGDTNFDALQGEFQRLFDAFNAADGAISVETFISQLERLVVTNREAAESIELSTIALNARAAAQQTALTLTDSSLMAEAEYAAAVDETTQSLMEQHEVQEKIWANRIERERARQDAEDDWNQQREDNVNQEQAEHEWRQKAWEDYNRILEQSRTITLNMFEGALEPVTGYGEAVGQAALNISAAAIASAEWAATLQSMGGATAAAGVEAIAAAMEAATQRAAELTSMLNQAAGTDTELGQWNAINPSAAGELASNLINAQTAAEGLFRVIVGNTEAIKSQASGVQDWADGLINARGELGRIDELLADGFIDQTQYNAAQDAYDSIAISTERIFNNLDAVQAVQAPLIAASQQQLAAYTQSLLALPPAQQLVALGWMDSATAAKAFEINALAAAAAQGEFGVNGVAAVESYIDAIVRTEPATAALLEQMGVINNVVRDSDGQIISYEFNLEGAAETQSEIEKLTESIYMLIDVLDDGRLNNSIDIEVNAEDNATPVVENAWDYLDSVNGATSTTYVENDNSNALAGISKAKLALGLLNGARATTYADTVDNASGTLSEVQRLLNGLNGRTVTTYVNTIYSGKQVGPTQALGGIPGYASGGTLGNFIQFRAGEGNKPEMAHFAQGGMAPIFTDGVYAAPPMTYISPHSANPILESGGGWTVNLNGNFYGSNRVELQEWLRDDILPAFRSEIKRLFGARGG